MIFNTFIVCSSSVSEYLNNIDAVGLIILAIICFYVYNIFLKNDDCHSSNQQVSVKQDTSGVEVTPVVQEQTGNDATSVVSEDKKDTTAQQQPTQG